ncbi:MAG: hypothetical protein COA42_16870 [Alteromonadaceae bacterium]|nr:MAG: hypothetical protein COA42_16870 [Alteromonadaceae bacterium]
MSSLFKRVVQSAGLMLACFSFNAAALTIDSFTGVTTQMEVTFTDVNDGVQVDFGFTPGSIEGDITGIWLGLDDALFNPSNVSANDISVIAPEDFQISVNVTEEDLFSGSRNLNGEGGFALQFDLDLSVFQENRRGSDRFNFLSLLISTENLEASHFDAAGARIQSIAGGGSSKLAGGVTPDVAAVPVPAAIYMFATALFGFFGLRRKQRA